MKVIHNDCIGCAVDSYPCRGSSCPKRNAAHYYCDRCKREEELYYFEGQELCLDCIVEQLEKVEGSEQK